MPTAMGAGAHVRPASTVLMSWPPVAHAAPQVPASSVLLIAQAVVWDVTSMDPIPGSSGLDDQCPPASDVWRSDVLVVWPPASCFVRIAQTTLELRARISITLPSPVHWSRHEAPASAVPRMIPAPPTQPWTASAANVTESSSRWSAPVSTIAVVCADAVGEGVVVASALGAGVVVRATGDSTTGLGVASQPIESSEMSVAATASLRTRPDFIEVPSSRFAWDEPIGAMVTEEESIVQSLRFQR